MELSIIIPAYNEEKRLPKTLEEINNYLRRHNYQSEIIVVSDGSKDKTVETVKNIALQMKNVVIIGRKENRGKGYTIREGMLAAKGDYRVFTDADNSTSIRHLEKVLPELKAGFPVVIGTRDKRDHKEALQAFPQPFYRRLLGDIFDIFVQTTLGLWGIWDTQCGFKGFTKEAAEKIFSQCLINRFAFDTEALVIAKKLRFKIKKVPVYWKNNAATTVKFRDMVKMAFDVLRIRKNLLMGKYVNK